MYWAKEHSTFLSIRGHIRVSVTDGRKQIIQDPQDTLTIGCYTDSSRQR